jgi:hypothetical protein
MAVRSPLVLLLVLAVSAGGCAFFEKVGLAPDEPDPSAVAAVPSTDAPQRVVVQHVLVSFEDAGVPGVTRSKDEALALARRVLEDAKSGRNFAELVRYYGDDRANDGRIALANWGVLPNPGEVERRRMARGFATCAFSLAVGEIGFVEHDPFASPYGWHVVKRLQ